MSQIQAINRDIAEYLVKHFAKTEQIYIVTILKYPVDRHHVDPCSFGIKVPTSHSLDEVYSKVYELLMQTHWGDTKLTFLHAYYEIDMGRKAKFVERLIMKNSITIRKVEDIIVTTE